MIYKKEIFSHSNTREFKLKMLSWADQFNIFCFLDNSGYETDAGFDCILAANSVQTIKPRTATAWEMLQNQHQQKPSWLFGHLGYGLKNAVYPSAFSKKDPVGFDPMFFFIPGIIIRIKNNDVHIESLHIPCSEIFNSILHLNLIQTPAGKIEIQHSITKQQYLEKIGTLQGHIKRGDCYEINFCQEFFAEDVIINPIQVYKQLAVDSPNPFAALYKLDEKYCICESPERYLQKKGNTLISQPIKGTAPRFPGNEIADNLSREQLMSSSKEKSENVMIVDLVRNDMSKVCKEGSVHVSELFGIYAFPQVYQMISTVKGELDNDIHFTEALKATFPMGSMTGAPKASVLKLIDAHESNSRGLFSGSIGYITPGGDFDFNVVIRSIFYNATKRYLSFWAGGGITFYSNPADEYEESLLKAATIKKILEQYL